MHREEALSESTEEGISLQAKEKHLTKKSTPLSTLILEDFQPPKL